MKNYIEYLPELAKKYMYKLIDRNKAESTVATFSADLKLFFDWYKKTNDVDIVTDEDIKNITYRNLSNYQGYLTSIGNSGVTRRKKLNKIKLFWEFLKKEYEIENVAEDIELPKVSRTIPKHLTEDQVYRFLNIIIKSNSQFKARDYAIFTMFLNTGLRKSELLDLKLEKVIKEKKGEYSIEIKRKGSNEQRIPLNSDTIEALKIYLEQRKEIIRKTKNNTEELFLTRDGNKISDSNLNRLFKQYAKKARLKKDITIHKLRHSFATQLYKNGVSLLHIKELLGHSSITTTQIYTHINNKELRNVVKTSAFNIGK